MQAMIDGKRVVLLSPIGAGQMSASSMTRDPFGMIHNGNGTNSICAREGKWQSLIERMSTGRGLALIQSDEQCPGCLEEDKAAYISKASPVVFITT